MLLLLPVMHVYIYCLVSMIFSTTITTSLNTLLLFYKFLWCIYSRALIMSGMCTHAQPLYLFCLCRGREPGGAGGLDPPILNIGGCQWY